MVNPLPHQQRQSTARSTNSPISVSTVRLAILLITAFIFGLALCSAFFLYHTHVNDPLITNSHLPHYHGNTPLIIPSSSSKSSSMVNKENVISSSSAAVSSSSSSTSILDGLRVLVTIVSFDFMQLSHLEEVLDGFYDLCYAGSKVDIVVYTTVLYPVALIDMLNDRMRCNNPSPNAGMTMTLMLKPSRVRLHLVDFHRELFYERIDQYDVFIYTEDDIRISPKVVASYLHETKRVESLVGPEHANDFNVGIVRYEYDFPENVVITDKTRHASVNVTRVYWEHIGRPIFEKSVDKVADEKLAPYYISMHKPHQGMYLVTPKLLKAWKDRGPNCRFNEIRNRPSSPKNPSQPTEGTQRVWMSSQMMYGGRHCNIKQLLPVENFGQLTVLHLPNKNYRRVGKQGRLGGNDNAPKNEFSDGTEVFQRASTELLKSLELHMEMKRQFPNLQTSNVGKDGTYTGIRVVDTDANIRSMHKNHRQAAEAQIEAYRSYVKRGGYMIDSDMNIDVEAWRTTGSL